MDNWGIDIQTLVNGSAGAVSLYMALQIRRVLESHERRLTNLEDAYVSRSGRTHRKPR